MSVATGREIGAVVVAVVVATLLPGSGRGSPRSLHTQMNNDEHKNQA